MTRLADYIHELNALVKPCVGAALRSIVCGAIEAECTLEDVNGGVGWVSGEVRLQFYGAPCLYLGWGENDGWQDHFSLAVQSITTFKPESLVAFSAESAPEWRLHIGSVLRSVQCRGTNDTPHALIFTFPNGSVVVGDGFEGILGDGDDIIIATVQESNVHELEQVFWSAAAAN